MSANQKSRDPLEPPGWGMRYTSHKQLQKAASKQPDLKNLSSKEIWSLYLEQKIEEEIGDVAEIVQQAFAKENSVILPTELFIHNYRLALDAGPGTLPTDMWTWKLWEAEGKIPASPKETNQVSSKADESYQPINQDDSDSRKETQAKKTIKAEESLPTVDEIFAKYDKRPHLPLFIEFLLQMVEHGASFEITGKDGEYLKKHGMMAKIPRKRKRTDDEESKEEKSH